MTKTCLPVLFLKNIVLFPYSEIRLELDANNDKELISLAESFYNKHILIAYQTDALEEVVDLANLSKVGIVGYISMKLDLPNNKTRVVIRGLNRVLISKFDKKEDNSVISEVEDIKINELNNLEEMAYSRSLIKQLEYYIEHNPNASNGVLSQILGINDINKITDILVNTIPLTYERKLEYINEVEPTSRVMMLLDDINQELKIIALESSIEERVGKNLEKSQKEYILNEKIKAIKEELGVNFDRDDTVEKLKDATENLDAPLKIKQRIHNEIKRYEKTPISSPEVSMILNYIEIMLNLPWNKKTPDNKNFKKAMEILDNSHFGLKEAKERIIEFLALQQHTSSIDAPVICLVGPPGVGKTTLAKSIAKAMNRKCTKISVGGINDEAEIMGHRRAYIGSSYGKIISGMKKAGVSNPVFIIDEIDKMTKDIKGDPASSLLEILDKNQNKRFCDNYIEEEYDLSNVFFICTANYKEQIPLELYDRMEIIDINSYTEYEKLNIAKNYIIPKGIKEYNLKKESIIFEDEAILKIIRDYTKEAGVRELERLIYSILRKIVKEIVVNRSLQLNIIDDRQIEKYLGIEKYHYNNNDNISSVGVVNGLSYSIFGGDVLKIEVNFYKGNGNIVLTGLLGDVFKESASLALSYIKSNYKKFNINYKLLEENDIHIHVPEGAIKKDGPSAGIALTTAIISALTNLEIPNNISMTGEITLRGKVLPIGGLKEKIIGAKRYGIRKIFLPKENEKDVEIIEKEIKRSLKFIYVKTYEDVYNKLLKEINTKVL